MRRSRHLPSIVRATAAAVTIAAALASAPGAAAAGWTQYGFNAQHTFRNPSETALTSSTVTHLRPGWTADLGADAYLATTPTVAGGRVYVVDATGPLVAFDAASGARLWSVQGGATGQPAVAGGHVLACIGGVIRALDPRTGAQVFTAGPCLGSPAVDGGRGFTTAGVVRAWSVTTGRQLWHSPRGPHLADQVPTVGYGKVFAAGALGDARNMYVLDEATGRVLNVRHTARICNSDVCGWNLIGGSAIVGGKLWTVQFEWCLACADIDGWAYLHTFAVAPGHLRLPPETDAISEFANDITGPPVVGDGHVYVPSVSTPEAAYPVAPGAQAWASTLTSTMGVTLAGGVAYFADCGCALATADGRLLWSSGSGYSTAAPAVAGGVAYWPQGTVLRTYRLPG
jgi:outer membrane protein assembly factor BamB